MYFCGQKEINKPLFFSYEKVFFDIDFMYDDVADDCDGR